MQDSKGIDYSADVKDMLAKTYNFMVKYNFDLTNPTQVYRAEVQSLGYHPSTNYCEKFVKEIDYIKEVVKNQPITKFTIKYYYTNFEGKTPVLVLSDTEETHQIKTFDPFKMGHFNANTEYDSKNPTSIHGYKTFEIIKVEKINHEYLLESK